MAQLFTVHFPKYTFEVLEEFTITFPDAQDLPFTVGVSDRGIAHILKLRPLAKCSPHRSLEAQWTKQGLKPGLKMTAVDGKPVAKSEIAGAIEVTNLTEQDINVLFADFGVRPVAITFTEHIPEGESVPLGLSWTDPNAESLSEHKADSDAVPPVDAPAAALIATDQISASSHHEGCPPSAVRLNHPSLCWRPSLQNELDRAVWIAFDLGSKRVVDGVQLQGSHDEACYVREFWIDYSDDGCSWTGHSMRAIRCRYIETRSKAVSPKQIPRTEATFTHSVHSEDKMGGPSPLEEDQSVIANFAAMTNRTPYRLCTVKIWPVIKARFVRIRPTKWRQHAALRLELLQSARPLESQQIGRVFDLKTVDAEYEGELRAKLERARRDRDGAGDIMEMKAVQMDCRFMIKQAMFRAGCERRKFVLMDVDRKHCVLYVQRERGFMFILRRLVHNACCTLHVFL